MACPPLLDAVEQVSVEALGKVQEYRVSGETLTLLDKYGEAVGQLAAVFYR